MQASYSNGSFSIVKLQEAVMIYTMKHPIKSHYKHMICVSSLHGPCYGPVGPVLQADPDHARALGSYHRRHGTEETHGRSDPHEPGGLVVVSEGALGGSLEVKGVEKRS